jgi:hypothetical protein
MPKKHLDQMEKNFKGCEPKVWLKTVKQRSWSQSSSIQITLWRRQENSTKANQWSWRKEWTITSGVKLSNPWGIMYIKWDVKNKEVCLWSLCKVNYMKASYAVLDANPLNLCFLLAFANLGTRFLLRGVDL